MTTITPEQYRDFRLELERNSPEGALRDVLGITIAPPAPSEAMVKLARGAFVDNDELTAADAWPVYRAGFTDALHHVEKLVLDAPKWPQENTPDAEQMRAATFFGGRAIPETYLLRAIGSNRHD